MLLKMLVLATVPVHETSLANQHFYSMLLGEGVCKKNTLSSLVKMLKIMDGYLDSISKILNTVFTWPNAAVFITLA